jgi:hypothetical protein
MENSDESDPAVLADVASIQLPDREEMDSLNPQEVSSHLQKLLEIQKQLSAQQVQLQKQLREVRMKMSKVQQLPPVSPAPVLSAQSAKNTETVTVLNPADMNESSGEIITRTGAQQVLHILELPTSSPSGKIFSVTIF